MKPNMPFIAWLAALALAAGNAAFAAAPLEQDLVRNVQQALEDRGVEAGPIDGIWGPKTAQALKEFQRANGLEASGRLDGATLSALGIPADQRAASGGTSRAEAAAARAGMATRDVDKNVQFQREQLGK